MYLNTEIVKIFSELLQVVEEKQKKFSEVSKKGDELSVNIRLRSDVKVSAAEGGGETHYADEYLSITFKSTPFSHYMEVSPVDTRNLQIAKLAILALADEAIEKVKDSKK